MIAFIPLRVVTLMIGLILGYSVGDWIEKLYDKDQIPREAVERLLFKVAEHIHFDGLDSDDEQGLDDVCFDCCHSGTDSDEGTEYSE